MSREYERKIKEEKPVVAICYDFDKTLSPDDMQAQGYIQSVGYDVPDFWKKSNSLAADNEMDQNLSYMYMMKQASEGKVLFTKPQLAEYGASVKLFPGVERWFERIREYGKEKDVIVEHYIISSGLKEMIEGTTVAREGVFEKIYASSFYYNENGVAVWPAQVVNYTNKTQFLFRIEKGVLDINDPAVNDSFSPEEIRVPFRNMIYIGDSDTDIPCMKLVTSYGGHSIGVYDATGDNKTKVYKMMRDGRIRYFAPANYAEGAELDSLVKSIIDRTATNEALEKRYYKCKNEQLSDDNKNNAESRKKTDLIIALDNSNNFIATHSLVSELRKIANWTYDEKKLLLQIAVRNSQVRYILHDTDVRLFYITLLDGFTPATEESNKVKHLLEKDD
ncbi:HAD family hydrolase [Bifidobacterium pullorum]|uniref:HAD family hydrolase n=1 Tax=Bifidobacterium pullorum TaxID=78448 RepID=UPI0009E01AF3|nr:HAD family hydrolase [Bifidobacterium pullorum]